MSILVATTPIARILKHDGKPFLWAGVHSAGRWPKGQQLVRNYIHACQVIWVGRMSRRTRLVIYWIYSDAYRILSSLFDWQLPGRKIDLAKLFPPRDNLDYFAQGRGGSPFAHVLWQRGLDGDSLLLCSNHCHRSSLEPTGGAECLEKLPGVCARSRRWKVAYKMRRQGEAMTIKVLFRALYFLS